jgi:hypothetical protein
MSAKKNLVQSTRPLPRAIADAVLALQAQVGCLQQLAKKHAPKLNFTLDGRLVGDIGELLTAMTLGIEIQKRQETGFDGTDKEGRNVEIKTTFKESFAFRKIAERIICIKLHGFTHWEIIYDGPGTAILGLFAEDAFKGPKTITRERPASLKSQRQLAISKFRALALITAH